MSDQANEEVQRQRREILLAYIREHFSGSVNGFATALERKQPQISETLKGLRSFGEKLARGLEGEVDALRSRPEWKHLPALRFEGDSGAETHPRLAKLIAIFESIPDERTQDLLIEVAGSMAQKSGNEAAGTQVGRDSPVRGPGSLQPGYKAAPKKHRRA